MEANNITHLSKEAFSGIPRLQILYFALILQAFYLSILYRKLSNQPLTDLQDGAFSLVPNLQQLQAFIIS